MVVLSVHKHREMRHGVYLGVRWLFHQVIIFFRGMQHCHYTQEHAHQFWIAHRLTILNFKVSQKSGLHVQVAFIRLLVYLHGFWLGVVAAICGLGALIFPNKKLNNSWVSWFILFSGIRVTICIMSGLEKLFLIWF